MSYTAMRFLALQQAQAGETGKSAASFDTRLLALAGYLIGRFA
jgi:hypothetical protein